MNILDRNLEEMFSASIENFECEMLELGGSIELKIDVRTTIKLYHTCGMCTYHTVDLLVLSI